MTERQGIEIDYCPQCRGVWLDRGELDKIIERSNQAAATVPTAHGSPQGHAAPGPAGGGYPPPRGGEPYREYDSYEYKKRKKRGWLGELFDD